MLAIRAAGGCLTSPRRVGAQPAVLREQGKTSQHDRVLRRDDGSLWKLGAGAMGVTYEAIDTHRDAPVARKVINALHTGHDAAHERFIREAKAAASLRHRNVASIHHLGRGAQSFLSAFPNESWERGK